MSNTGAVSAAVSHFPDAATLSVAAPFFVDLLNIAVLLGVFAIVGYDCLGFGLIAIDGESVVQNKYNACGTKKRYK